MLDWALEYARMGWEVFPVPPGKKSSHKSASKSNGHRWGSTKDADEIRRDFAQWPDANVGIPTGEINGIFVVEADTPEGHDVDGLASIAELEARHGPLPMTLTATSPSGSVHRYFKHQGEIRNSTSTVAPGVDVRGEGGMVVAPPSAKAGAGIYKWTNWGTAVAEAPPWLLELATRRPERASLSAATRYPPADEADVAAALKIIPNTGEGGWDAWNRIGMATHAATGGSEAGGRMFDEWSQKNAAKYDAATTAERWRVYATSPPSQLTVGTLFYEAEKIQPGWRRRQEAQVTVDDFRAYMPMHQYIYMPSRDLWPAASVNSRIGQVAVIGKDGKAVLDGKGRVKKVSASQWLDKNRPVEQMTWAPGMPTLIEGRLINNGGWVSHEGATTFNTYQAPGELIGNPTSAEPWLDHVREIYPEDWRHIVSWLAHRVQRPEDKINHALCLVGAQGIGKDTLLEPVKRAVGPWNFNEISPKSVLESWNSWLKSVILRISEARDLGESNRYQFYEHMKTYTASPPDVLMINEKHIRHYMVLNCCGVIITTNRKDSLYLPADDRRHYVAWSESTKNDFGPEHWTRMWRWYDSGGDGHVAAYLRTLDISSFDSKAPPKKTPVFWEIVETNRSPEESELSTIILALGDPAAVTIDQVIQRSSTMGDFYNWITDRKNRRAIPHRMEECGYVPVRNDAAISGLWVVGGSRQVIYAKTILSPRERLRACTALVQASH